MENIGDKIVKVATRMRVSFQALNQITDFCEICCQFFFFSSLDGTPHYHLLSQRFSVMRDRHISFGLVTRVQCGWPRVIIQFPTGEGDFSELQSVHTFSTTHPTSRSLGTVVISSGARGWGHEAKLSPPPGTRMELHHFPISVCCYEGSIIRNKYMSTCGDRCSTVVKVLCYKSEGRWFDSRWCHRNSSLT